MATPTAASKREPRALPELVQSLPQELFDRIYEETINWEIGHQRVFDGDGRALLMPSKLSFGASNIIVNSQLQFPHPPTSLLRVDRTTRYRLLKKFYSNVVFTILGTKGDTKAIIAAKERKSNAVPLDFALESYALSTSCTSPDVSAFAKALWTKGLGRGLKWNGHVFEDNEVEYYNWSWVMEKPNA